MERSRLLQCLAADYLRLREVAATGLNAKVPSCPGWTVSDLVRHVGEVYLHKATVMQTGAWPEPWPPSTTAIEDPIALLDRAYGAVTHEFSRRGDSDRALTWHQPDQTVKFWIRRMAHESVIHRLDAELAHDVESAPIADDLALDGIDEILQVMVGYCSHTWREELADLLSTAKGRTIRIQVATPPASTAWPTPSGAIFSADASSADPAFASGAFPAAPASSAGGSPASSAGPASTAGAQPGGPASASASSAVATGGAPGRPPIVETTPAWLVRIDLDGATITPITSASTRSAPSAAAAQAAPDAVVTGSLDDLLRWLWSRESNPTTDVHPPIRVEGDEEAIDELHALLRALTQ
jgi:uncharacterized protein (TIGR03083 family)